MINPVIFIVHILYIIHISQFKCIAWKRFSELQTPKPPPPPTEFVTFVHVFNMLNMNLIEYVAAALSLVNVLTNL